ncbi:MAG: hypothetical protein WBK28_01775, partial [Minisyncoccia bacterium]
MDPLLEKKYISTREAALSSGYNSDYLARLCRSGKITGTQVGRTWLLNRESLASFIEEQESLKKKSAGELAKKREVEYKKAQETRILVSEPEAPILSPIASEVPMQPIAVVSRRDEDSNAIQEEKTSSVVSPIRVRRPLPSPTEYLPESFNPWSSYRNEAAALSVALLVVTAGLFAASENYVSGALALAQKYLVDTSYVGRDMALSAMHRIRDIERLLQEETAMGVVTVLDHGMISVREGLSGEVFGTLSNGLIFEGVYEAFLGLGNTLQGATYAVLALHEDGMVLFAKGSQEVPQVLLTAVYQGGESLGTFAYVTPNVLATGADTAFLAVGNTVEEFSSGVAYVGQSLGGSVRFGSALGVLALSRTVETMGEVREKIATAFEYRIRERAPALAATPEISGDIFGFARSLARFTYERIQSLFDQGGRMLAALFDTNLAYAPAVSYPIPAGLSTVMEVSRVVNEITNHIEYHPVTYVYSGGVTEEFVKKMVETLREDINDRDDSGGSGLADISSESIEDLADVATMTKTWGDLLYWNGIEWTNLATSSLGIVGSGIPGGVVGAIQYNGGGTFAGDSAFTFDAAADRVTTTYASSTGLSSLYASSTNLFAGTLTLFGSFFDTTGSQGTNGFVLQSTGTSTHWVATSTLGLGGGGSGTVSAGTAGQIPYYEANGTTLTATSSIFVAPTGNVGLGTTSPYARLSVVGQVVAEFFTATTTTASSTFPRVSMNSFALGSDYFTDLTGPGLTVASGVLSVDDVSPSMLQAADFGAFTCNGTSCSLDSSFENPLTFTYPLVRSVDTISLAFGTTTANTWSAQNTFASLFATNASSTNATTTNLHVTSLSSALLRADSNGRVTGTTIGSGLSFDGTTLSATGGGGSGTVSTSTSETSGNVAYWTSTSGTPATLGSDSGLQFNAAADRLTTTYASSTALSSSYASSTSAFFGALSVGALSGPLQAVGGLVSASSTLSVAYGGTGLSTAPSFGNILVGNSTGSYTLTATSSLGLGTITAVGPTGGQVTSGAVTLASSTAGTDFSITGAGNTLTFNLPSASAVNRGLLTSSDYTTFQNKVSSTSLSATFPLAYSSASGAFTFNGLSTSTAAVVGNIPYFSGVNTFANVATSTLAVAGPFTTSGILGALVGGTNSTVTYTGLSTTTALSSSGVLYSTNGAAGVSSAAT